MNQESIEEHSNKEFIASPKHSLVNYYVAMAVDTVLLYILNNLRYMNINVITKEFISCLWVINLSLSLGIIGNFILLLYHPKWFHHLVQAILSALTVLTFYLIYLLFPFDLSEKIWETVVRGVMIAMMVGITIAFIFEVGKFIRGLILYRKKLSPEHRDTQPPLQDI